MSTKACLVVLVALILVVAALSGFAHCIGAVVGLAAGLVGLAFGVAVSIALAVLPLLIPFGLIALAILLVSRVVRAANSRGRSS